MDYNTMHLKCLITLNQDVQAYKDQIQTDTLNTIEKWKNDKTTDQNPLKPYILNKKRLRELKERVSERNRSKK